MPQLQPSQHKEGFHMYTHVSLDIEHKTAQTKNIF